MAKEEKTPYNMANEEEKLEIKKKPQKVSDKDLDKTAGGAKPCAKVWW